jgi:membrane-bound ClpP family serine protease
MKRNFLSFKIILRYTLLQLPVIFILIFFLILSQKNESIPTVLVWSLLILWIIKDIILYPLMWRAYDLKDSQKRHPMIGLQGITYNCLNTSGYIRIRGELWRAKPAEGISFIKKGEKVEVCGIEGLTLLVKPYKNPRSEFKINIAPDNN